MAQNSDKALSTTRLARRCLSSHTARASSAVAISNPLSVASTITATTAIEPRTIMVMATVRSPVMTPALTQMGVPTTAARGATLRQHLQDSPTPIVADALGFHPSPRSSRRRDRNHLQPLRPRRPHTVTATATQGTKVEYATSPVPDPDSWQQGMGIRVLARTKARHAVKARPRLRPGPWSLLGGRSSPGIWFVLPHVGQKSGLEPGADHRRDRRPDSTGWREENERERANALAALEQVRAEAAQRLETARTEAQRRIDTAE